MKNFISPVLIVLAMVIGYFYIKPSYEHVSLLKEKKQKHVEMLESIQSIETKISSLEAQYNSFTPREKGLLTRLIPREAREAVVVNDLTALADSHGLRVTDIEFETAELPEENVQVIGEDEALSAVEATYEKWHSIVRVQGPYENFKEFLADLGRSVRIADVSHIEIKQAETEGRSLVEYQVTVTLYSLE